MATANIELVRRASSLVTDSCQAGEASEELLAMCTPEVRVDASRRVFNPDVYEGAEGLQRMVREIHDAWEDFSEGNREFLEAGEKVVALQTISGRGRSSGIEVKSDGALVWTVRDGLVTRVEVFADRGEALAAAGLDAALSARMRPTRSSPPPP